MRISFAVNTGINVVRIFHCKSVFGLSFDVKPEHNIKWHIGISVYRYTGMPLETLPPKYFSVMMIRGHILGYFSVESHHVQCSCIVVYPVFILNISPKIS